MGTNSAFAIRTPVAWPGGRPDLIATREERLPETDGLGRWQETVWLYVRE